MKNYIGHTVDQAVEASRDEKAIKIAKKRHEKVKGEFYRVPDMPGNLSVFVPEGKNIKRYVAKYKKNIGGI